MKSIKFSELKPEYNIIDIRSKRSYMRSHIYNAKNIDENNLIDMPHLYLDKNKTYYIYCSTSGSLSHKKIGEDLI